MRQFRHLFLFVLIFLLPLNTAWSQEKNNATSENLEQNSSSSKGEGLATNSLELDFSKHKVTFIELGADMCIPSRAMHPIMGETGEESKGKTQVVFYDAWKDPRPAPHYRIQLIPPQVFIDQNGKKVFWHVGFFPKDEILEMFKEKGIL